MALCSDCKIEFPRHTLAYHHDPPKSRIFKDPDGHTYFNDMYGGKFFFKEHSNRKLCRSCHRKADIQLGLPDNKFHKIPKRLNRWHLKFGQGRALYK